VPDGYEPEQAAGGSTPAGASGLDRASGWACVRALAKIIGDSQQSVASARECRSWRTPGCISCASVSDQRPRYDRLHATGHSPPLDQPDPGVRIPPGDSLRMSLTDPIRYRIPRRLGQIRANSISPVSSPGNELLGSEFSGLHAQGSVVQTPSLAESPSE
jgi:hypothetical protein